MTRLKAALLVLYHFSMLCMIGLAPVYFGATAIQGGLLTMFFCGFAVALGMSWVPEHKQGFNDNLITLIFGKAQRDSEDIQNDPTPSDKGQP